MVSDEVFGAFSAALGAGVKPAPPRSSGVSDFGSVAAESGVYIAESASDGFVACESVEEGFRACPVMLFPAFVCAMSRAIASSFLQSSDFSFAKQMSMDELIALISRCLSSRLFAYSGLGL